MDVDSLYPQEDMSPLETMDDYTSDFRMIFKEVSEEQIRKNPRTIISYMRDTRMDPAIIRVVETMIMYSRMDFIASITSPDDSVLKSVDRIASNTFVDKGVLTQLINMIRDARGVGVVAIQPVVTKVAPMSTTVSAKATTKTTAKPIVKMVACKDPKTRLDVMKAEDDSAYYSKDLDALYRCDKNTIVLVIPDSVKWISPDAFKGCYKLREIYFPESMTILGCNLSDCCLLETVHIPNTVTKLDRGCFKDCSSLVNVELPSSLVIIESIAFSKCSSLREITIPDSVVVIKSFAFTDCKSLKKVTIQGKNTILEDRAFSYGCVNLKDVYIPKELSLSKGSITSGNYAIHRT